MTNHGEYLHLGAGRRAARFFWREEGCQRHPLQFSGRLDVNPARSAELLGLRETPTHLLNKPTRYLSIADNSSEDCPYTERADRPHGG